MDRRNRSATEGAAQSMSLAAWAYVGLSVGTGWLAWRGTHNLWRSILAGLFAPLIALIAFGSFVGRDDFEAMEVVWVLVGAAVTLAVLVLVYRD